MSLLASRRLWVESGIASTDVLYGDEGRFVPGTACENHSGRDRASNVEDTLLLALEPFAL